MPAPRWKESGFWRTDGGLRHFAILRGGVRDLSQFLQRHATHPALRQYEQIQQGAESNATTWEHLATPQW